jgi:predicted acylesterase/phospholipase RssA
MAAEHDPIRIGREGEDVIALTFSGGGFATAMQLGAIHALLVSHGRAPDVVLGISAGAVNAAALAEIFQAGPADDPEARRRARVARFREYLELFQSAPAVLANALWPDPYEIANAEALETPVLPTHRPEEVEHRQLGVRERSGLIRLVNDLFALRLSVAAATRFCHLILSWIEAPEKATTRSAMRRRRALIALGLWLLAGRHLAALGHPLRIALQVFFGRGGNLKSGRKAGQIIRRQGRARKLFRGVRHVLETALAGALWLAAPLLAPLALLAPRRPKKIDAKGYFDRFLDRYRLHLSLGNVQPLRELLIRFFDPGYYKAVTIEEALDLALDRRAPAGAADSHPKPLEDYVAGSPPIYVAPVAEDLISGRLEPLAPGLSVVESLLAATALVPVFPVQRLDVPEASLRLSEEDLRRRRARGLHTEARQYVDGVNVANEPTSALMGLYQERGVASARCLLAYTVATLPISRASLPDEKRTYPGLLAVVERVMELKHFRDARLEKALTELYTRILPEGRAIPLAEQGQPFVRAEILPIEPEVPLHLSFGLPAAGNREEYRTKLLETVAIGCRATLEATISRSITTLDRLEKPLSCHAAIQLRTGAETPFPGSNPKFGPGLAEVCRNCRLFLGGESLQTDRGRHEWPLEPGTSPPSPFETDEGPATTVLPFISGAHDQETTPLSGPPVAGPTVSLLSSGGVFRGVFQVGVLAGLSEAGLRPTIFAGASVGSIMAAMSARAFAASPGAARNERLGRLAGTFLALDRFVLTDRFADFIRRFTLRAAGTKVAISDLDRLLRRYDEGSTTHFLGTSRRVIAGLERLLYISPFELLELIRLQREGSVSELSAALGASVQDFLDRYGVGEEILGAERLAYLIREHAGVDQRTTIDDFRESTGAILLAVATNLTEGRLDLLGGDQPNATGLLEALLAGSAFPAVFRPRWSSEVVPNTDQIHQYTDGGVMDNLPLDAVVRFLDRQSRPVQTKKRLKVAPYFERRPIASGHAVPHVLFAASLERWSAPIDPAYLREGWFAARARAEELRYNRKVDDYRSAQRHFRAILTLREQGEPKLKVGWKPLDLEVVPIKPKWLCGTFAFNPMLGFRRQRQAENIAHGCASTLGTLYTLSLDSATTNWFPGWEIDGFAGTIDPRGFPESNPKTLRFKLAPQPRKAPGACWFRNGALCPFSRTQLRKQDVLSETQRAELEQIYQACGRKETHRTKGDRREAVG